MNIGELFINLGIKGSEKTIGALTSVSKGMGEAKNMSLEAKAGIIGAMYALERMFAASGAAGTGLTNFNAILGVSAQTLQKYQYAARQMGVANGEVEGTFKSLQSVITKSLMGQAPTGLARLANVVGDISSADMLRFQQNPELLIQKLQQYAQKEKNVGLRNEVLRSFGVGDSMIAAMARGGFNPGAINRAPTYGDKEIAALDRANIAWANLGNKIEMAVGHFNAKHGGQLVRDISMITEKVVILVESFVKLAESVKVFQLIGKAFEGWGKIFDGLNGLVGKGGLSGFLKEMPGTFQAIGEDLMANTLMPVMPAPGANQTFNTNINNNFQHDGKDHKRTGDSVNKAVRDAFRQSSAQGQGS